FPLVWNMRLHTASSHSSVVSANIIGKITGSDPALRNEFVVYSAHLDHLGICPAVAGDNVCHGALDNASGVATLLEIARAYATLSRAPRRSVLFLFVTAEEIGDMEGSDYFAHYPTVPKQRIVADINIDIAPGRNQEIICRTLSHALGQYGTADHYDAGAKAARMIFLLGYDVAQQERR